MTQPIVSVLLPVQDEAPYLGVALESLSAQTFPDFEVLVVDDGSTDGSAEIAEAHARRRPVPRPHAGAGRHRRGARARPRRGSRAADRPHGRR